MMSRPKRVVWVAAAMLMASCSKQPEPPKAAESTTAAVPPLPTASADVLRAQLTASGIATEYAAHFAQNQLTRIVEQRRVGESVIGGDYEFKGARLIRYSGAPLAAAGELDLRFDLQGVLQTQPGSTVEEEDVRALRGRAQLLRNHALAQRATKTHR